MRQSVPLTIALLIAVWLLQTLYVYSILQTLMPHQASYPTYLAASGVVFLILYPFAPQMKENPPDLVPRTQDRLLQIAAFSFLVFCLVHLSISLLHTGVM